MAAANETQDPTLPASEEGPEARPHLALIILFHADLSRVGEVAEVALEKDGQGECLIGRETPLFRRPGEAAGRALLDPCISRRQLTLRAGPGGILRADPEPGARRSVALLDALGQPASTETARSGAILALGDRVLLGLQLRGEEAEPGDLGMVGQSPAIGALRRRVRDLAAGGSDPLLILGETGAGKELVARALHEASPRRAAPFVAVNCAAIPENLLESELFGHVRGAFTGATGHEGLVRSAREGTLFLDEIGELPAGVQAKLLRALELRLVRPVGSTSEHPFQARLVAATHRDLDQAAARGAFREDLLARLDGLRLLVPPLRERPGISPFSSLTFCAAASMSRPAPAPHRRSRRSFVRPRPPRLPCRSTRCGRSCGTTGPATCASCQRPPPPRSPTTAAQAPSSGPRPRPGRPGRRSPASR
jgi:hypothetical protein